MMSFTSPPSLAVVRGVTFSTVAAGCGFIAWLQVGRSATPDILTIAIPIFVGVYFAVTASREFSGVN